MAFTKPTIMFKTKKKFHKSTLIQNLLAKYSYKELDNSPYSLNIAHSDFHLFLALEHCLITLINSLIFYLDKFNKIIKFLKYLKNRKKLFCQFNNLYTK